MALTNLTMLPPNRAEVLRNSTCVYCGCDLTVSGSTKEHVIGRRFVPKGSLHGRWNLIVRACPQCNGQKSDLEDDISAVTLAFAATGHLAKEDPLLAAEIHRKAMGSISRRTGRAIADSTEPMTIRTALGSNVTLTARMTSPPQIDHTRAFDLARLQLRAFYYRLTYDSTTKLGKHWPG